jgi:hypothetical protein
LTIKQSNILVPKTGAGYTGPGFTTRDATPPAPPTPAPDVAGAAAEEPPTDGPDVNPPPPGSIQTRDDTTSEWLLNLIAQEIGKNIPVLPADAANLSLMQTIYRGLHMNYTWFQEYFTGMEPTQLMPYHDRFTDLSQRLLNVMRENKVIQSLLLNNPGMQAMAAAEAPKPHFVAGGLD